MLRPVRLLRSFFVESLTVCYLKYPVSDLMCYLKLMTFPRIVILFYVTCISAGASKSQHV